MKPGFSEFSYGFALTSDFVEGLRPYVKVAPVFPSLRQEGSTGGYDVQMDLAGRLLFLQFKLSDCMVRNSAFETRGGALTVPFYRFHLRSRRHSKQHELLLSLEAQRQEVYYAAPGFHSGFDLDAAFRARATAVRSIFVRPSEIGPLPDDYDHHVSFQGPDSKEAFLYSPPPHRPPLETRSGGELLHELVDDQPTEPLRSAVERALSVLTIPSTLQSAQFDLPPLAKVSALAVSTIGCMTFAIHPLDPSET